MDNQKLFLYAGLAFIGMLIWQQWQLDYGPKPAPVVIENANVHATNNQSAVISSDSANDLPELASDNANKTVGQVASSMATKATAKIITVETDSVEAKIDTRGGVIISLKLKHYPVALDKKDELLELAFKREDELFVIQSGLMSKNSVAPTHHDVYQATSLDYKLSDGANELVVPMTWQKDGITVTKSFIFSRDSYAINVTHQVNNESNQSWSGSQYRQITRSRPLKTSKIIRTYVGPAVYNEEVKFDKIKFDDIEEKNLNLKSDGGWIAMIQHYFLAAWIPEQTSNLMYSLKNLKTYPATFTIGMRSDNSVVNNHSEHTFKSQLFVGPKLVHKLEELSPGLELTIDYGYLTVISKPLYWLLEHIHAIVGNWGLAIILLTVLIKGVFYKLSETSYRSMAKMRKVGPRLKALKERFGDDRQAMNKAMMELYKKEKINPMSGCLPIVIQIPVFIGLYWALLESIELRQAPFILWIQDLSVMDPYYVLPVIMGISMLIQQRLNPAPPDPIQAKVMMALPFVFTIFFAFFPAGLVLYWVVNNILSISQQYVITKRIEAEK